MYARERSRCREQTANPIQRANAERLSLAFLFDLKVLAEDRLDLVLHERPRHVRVSERAFLAAGAVHLQHNCLSTFRWLGGVAGGWSYLLACALMLDAVAAARKTELVLLHRGTLHKVCVLEAFLTNGTA